MSSNKRFNELNTAELSEQLQDLANWQQFAIFLEGITKPDIDDIISNNPYNVANQRIALYDLWLRRCPNPSWDHVITALDKAREYALAQQIREHIVKCEEQALDQSQPYSQVHVGNCEISGQPSHTTSTEPTEPRILEHTREQTHTTEISRDTVQKLADLQDSFNTIVYDFKEELRQKTQSDKCLLDKIVSRAAEESSYKIKLLDDVKDTNSFLKVIQPYYSFLDYHLLLILAKKFLDQSEVLEKLQKHEKSIRMLKCNVKIKELQSILHLFILESEKSPNQFPIIIKAQMAWGKNELNAVEVLLKTLFPFEHQWKLFRVEPGSVCITYLLPCHLAMLLVIIAYSGQHKKEFMRLTGIISLQVRNTCIQVSTENEQFTFEMGLMEAMETRNNEAVKFLIKQTHTNVNIQTLDNGGLGTITDTEKEIEQTQKTIEDHLTTDLQTTIAIQQSFDIMSQNQQPASIQTATTVEETIVDQLAITNIQAGITAATGSSEEKSEKEPDPVDLYELDSNGNMLFTHDPVGTTPLMIACINDDTDMIQLLLEHNANTNIQTRTGWTALMYAARLGNTRTVELLLKHNAEVDTIKKSNGATALMYGCHVGNLNTVTALLEHGADYERKMDGGLTPLCIASLEGHLEVIKRLLKPKLKANPNTQRDDGTTPLYIASAKGHSKVVERLLQANADTDTPTDDGTTPLCIASHNGHSEVVERLLQAKANPNAQRDNGTTPLYFASQNGHSEVVKRLLQAKANPNTPMNDGTTPLNIASQLGHSKVVKMLLEASAIPDIPTINGSAASYPS